VLEEVLAAWYAPKDAPVVVMPIPGVRHWSKTTGTTSSAT
jgi:hypothetical protein